MLRIEHYTKTYGDKVAVDDLTLHIAPGEIFGFIGHNGAGKTTTLKACSGILQFDQGDIFVNGKSVRTDPIGCKQDMAYVPDNPDLYEFLTGVQYLNFVADIYGVSREDRTARMKEYGELLGAALNPEGCKIYIHALIGKLKVATHLVVPAILGVVGRNRSCIVGRLLATHRAAPHRRHSVVHQG